MPMDLDVQIARDKWYRGEWSCWDVCRSIELQWADRHINDADGDGSNVNAHAPEDVAVFLEAAAACAGEIAKWATVIAAVVK